MERDPRAPFGPVAQPLLTVADRNLLWGEDAADRTAGILGIHLAGAQEFVAVSQVDGGNGTPRPPQAEEFVNLIDRW